jgi:MoxR-vWA-beta-propeller ternary system domain bpX4
MSSHYFYDTITQLRTNEEIILYDKVIEFTNEDMDLVTDFLQIEFETEAMNYPFSSPQYNAEASLWGAKTLYTACQILLYREHKDAELNNLLAPYPNKITPEAILSADLCLRFLPQVLSEATLIDNEDPLIPILNDILKSWHFSGIGIEIEIGDIDFETIFTNKTLEQLYIDRVIEKKDINRAKSLTLNNKIKTVLGNYSEHFWKNLN